MIERWRSIPNHPYYVASNTGKIVSYVRYDSGRLLKTCINNKGYEYVSLGRNNKQLVHRLVALAWLGDFKGMVVNHKDGNKRNNNIENLELTSYSENNKHAYRTGLKVVSDKVRRSGTKSVRGSLTESDLKLIKALRDIGSDIVDIAAVFDVHISTIYRVLNRKTYRGEF